MKPVAATCLLLLLLTCPFFSHGQGENNIWCFGHNYGLDFNTGYPVLFYDSMESHEGAVTVSDANGNLLFYASPEKIWDRANHLMPNGSGLLGHVSSTQGAAAIQSLSNPHQYYLFTLDADESYYPPLAPGYLRYSIVDMTLNNGFGDIVPGQKNIILGKGYLEKMVVAAGTDCYRWLIVHNVDSNIFHAYRVDINGVNTTPVVSVSGFKTGESYYIVSYMVMSPDSKHIVLANDYDNNNVEMHSFDPATGTVSGAISLEDSMNLVYGVCYSPDGTKLYLGRWHSGWADSASGGIWQYDVSLLPNVAAVKTSKTRVDTGGTFGIRQGPDNKLYTAHDPYNVGFEYISVINSPNLAGIACNVTPDVFGPLPYPCCLFTTFLGFGNPIVPNIYDTIYNVRDTFICFALGSQILSVPNGYTYYEWSDSTVGQVDTLDAPAVRWVYMYDGCTITIDTIHVTARLDTAKTINDTDACFVSSYPVLTAPGGYTIYLWSDGKNTQQDSISLPGVKWVMAQNGCSLLIDTFHVHAHFDTTAIVTDTTHCVAYSPITIFAPSGYNSYLWSDGKTTQVDTFFNSVTKWVTAQNNCSILIDTIHFTGTTIPADSVSMHGGDTVLCTNGTGSISIAAPAGYTYYAWSDGSTGQSAVFDTTGTKWVYAQKLCYLVIDTFNAQFIRFPRLDLGPDTALCPGQAITLDATYTAQGVKYLWQDGNTTPKYTVTSGGDYSVIVSVGPCSASDTVRVHEKIIDIHLGNGLIPCHQDSIILDAGVDNATYLWQDGSTKRIYKATKEGSYTVKVTQDDCSATASVTVRFEGCDCIVVLPTAFSPNNDGRNDKFGPLINCPTNSFKMMIYNRWGNQVFYSEDVNSRWDGTVKGIPVDGDTFNYYLEFKDSEGKSYYYKGTVTLVR